MVEHLEDKDVITIDLEKVFGRVVMLSAYQAEKAIDEEHPVVLVMGQEDTPLFLAHLDPVIADIRGLFTYRTEGVTREDDDLVIEIKKNHISSEGLNALAPVLFECIARGVLAQFQTGAKGYRFVQEDNERKYGEMLKQAAAIAAFRSDKKQRITSRFL